MSSLRRWIANIITFGLAGQMDADAEHEEANLKRIVAGRERIARQPTRDLSDVLRAEPFWRKERRR